MSALAKYRAYRTKTATEGVKPIGFIEWLLGRLAGRLEVAAATLAARRGDHASLNHALLGLWAGNQSGGGHMAAFLPPAELNRALKEGRLRIVIDPAD